MEEFRVFSIWRRSARLIGLSVSALAVGVGLSLAMQAVRAIRGSFVPIPGRRGVAVVWRLAAVGLLVGVVGAEILAVRPRVSSTLRGDLGLELFPLCGLLLVIGLLAGIKPPSPRRSERAGSAVAAVLLAVCLGVGLAAGHMIIPHLVLVAIEGVFNAHILRVDGRGLAARVWWSSVPGFVAMGSCVVVGIGLSRILRRGSSREAEIGRREWGVLAIGLALMLGSTLWLVGRSIPELNETIVSGVADVLGPVEILTIVAGFAGLSAGIVAGALGRTDGFEPEPRVRRVGRVAWGLLAVGLLVMAVGETVGEWNGAGSRGTGSLVTSLRASAWIDFLVDLWNYAWFNYGTPNAILLPAMLWACWRTIRLCGPWAVDRPSAFDVALGGPNGVGRVVGLTFALTILALAAMPAFFVTGLVIYQLRLIGPYGP